MTKAEKEYMERKARDLKVYGYYTVTMEELEELQKKVAKEQKKKATKK
jgi:hypothetical protein